MPTYDYKCPDCGFTDEVSHAMSESPEYDCPDCLVLMKKVYGVFNMKRGHSKVISMLSDKQRREADIKQELNESYGVEQVVPLASGGIQDVYNDVKAQGNYVRDQMQETAEKTEATKKAKANAWKKQAMKRAPQRSKELVARKAKEAQASRAITVKTSR